MDTEVNLFFWSLKQNASVVQWARAHLSQDEQEREARFATSDLRETYAVGRGVMRHLLSGVTGCSPAQLVFDYGAQGKPALRDGPLFNLSHTRRLACLAYCTAGPNAVSHIGVDIEQISPIEPDLAQSVFTPQELTAYRNQPPARRADAFFRCWTLKEAVMKASGLGMSLAPKSFSLDFMDARLLSLPERVPDRQRWSLAAFEPDPQVAGAVAVVGMSEAPKIHLRLNWWQR